MNPAGYVFEVMTVVPFVYTCTPQVFECRSACEMAEYEKYSTEDVCTNQVVSYSYEETHNVLYS